MRHDVLTDIIYSYFLIQNVIVNLMMILRVNLVQVTLQR